MPWHREAMKDVARCEKPRGGASARGSSDLRMGQPTAAAVSWSESIAAGGEPGELNHLSSRRKGHQAETPQVVASERGPGQWPRLHEPEAPGTARQRR
jgi:hypothetical protein